MSKNKNRMTPEDKLLKAIYGDKYKTEAEQEAEIEAQIASVSDEDYKKMWGESVDETVGKIMSDIEKSEKA